MIRAVLMGRRGVAALEFSLIFPIMIGLLLPIVDLGVAAFNYVSAYQTLRNLGAYARYHTPPDVTNLAGWYLPSINGYTITTQVMCGDVNAVCSASNAATPKWFVFSTPITLSPMFLSPLAGTYTVEYSERFQ